MQHTHRSVSSSKLVATALVATALFATALFVGCTPTVVDADRRVALDARVADRDHKGLAYDPARGTFAVLSPNWGLAFVDVEGALVDELPYSNDGSGEGFTRDAFGDVAIDDDGIVYVLAASEGFRYDPAVGNLEQHFCVLPEADPAGPIPDEPLPPPETLTYQENDALTFVDGTLIAAPRFYDGMNAAPTESLLSSYRASDGEPTGIANITVHGLNVRALAATREVIYALSDGDVHTFSREGEHTGTVSLPVDAESEAMVIVDDALVVADGTELAYFPLRTIDLARQGFDVR